MSVNRPRFEESCGLCGSRPSCGSVHAPPGSSHQRRVSQQTVKRRVDGEGIVREFSCQLPTPHRTVVTHGADDGSCREQIRYHGAVRFPCGPASRRERRPQGLRWLRAGFVLNWPGVARCHAASITGASHSYGWWRLRQVRIYFGASMASCLANHRACTETWGGGVVGDPPRRGRGTAGIGDVSRMLCRYGLICRRSVCWR